MTASEQMFRQLWQHSSDELAELRKKIAAAKDDLRIANESCDTANEKLRDAEARLAKWLVIAIIAGSAAFAEGAALWGCLVSLGVLR